MTSTEAIIKDMDYFMTDIFGRQKQLDLEIYVESLPKNLLKKKQYKEHIDEYKELKAMALAIDPSVYEPDPEDDALLELIVVFEELLALYNLYVDKGLNVQDFLRRKAEGEKYPHSEYSQATKNQKVVSQSFSKEYNEFSIMYSDYTQGVM